MSINDRVARLLDPAEAPSPLALLAPLPSGPFAGTPPRAAPHVPPAQTPAEADEVSKFAVASDAIRSLEGWVGAAASRP